MSLQWVLVAGFLYVEIAFALLLCVPVASPSTWRKLFKSKVLKVIIQQSSKYFKIVLFILVLLLCDSIRELRKYTEISSEERDKYANLDAEMVVEIRLFRAQRNFYVCGFSLVLTVVIRRMISLLIEHGELLKSMRTQQSDSGSEEVGQNKLNGAKTRQEELLDKLDLLEKDLAREKKDKEAMKNQAENIKREYDRLLVEHRKVQETISLNETKKDC